MTTKNIISTPWPVMSTFHRWPFGVHSPAAAGKRRAPSRHMYCTPGSISSIRMYTVKATAMKPTTAEVTR